MLLCVSLTYENLRDMMFVYYYNKQCVPNFVRVFRAFRGRKEPVQQE